jgi:hypothetical protein
MGRDVLAGVGITVILVAAVLGVLELVLKPVSQHVHLACVDQFTQQSFQTDRSVTRVEVWPEAYALHRTDGTLTVIQRTDNMVCNLSTEYPPDATSTTP